MTQKTAASQGFAPDEQQSSLLIELPKPKVYTHASAINQSLLPECVHK
jgi:hypothetical protein